MSSHKKRRIGRGSIIFLLIVAVVAILTYDSNTRLVTDEFELYSRDLPSSFDGMRVVQLSDIHTAEFGNENEILLDEVRAANPDIITVTGDFIDGERAESYVRGLMSSLCEIAPVYYVTGNHEWACGWIREFFEILDDCGVNVLRNEYCLLEKNGDTIVIAGADDPNGPYDMMTHEELVSEIREREGGKYILMLYHRNNNLEEWEKLGIDTVLCGHAHGGVVRFPFTDGLISPDREWFPEATSGLHKFGETEIIISRGMGNTSGALRFLNNPEIVVAVLKSKQA